MRNIKVTLLVFALSLCVFGVNAPASKADLFSSFQKNSSRPDSFADLADALLPAVVNISSTQKAAEPQDMENMPDMPQFPPGSPFEDFFKDFFDNHHGAPMPNLPASSLGSGFVIDANNGYIVTNNHVIKDADEVRVTFHDDETLEAEVIGRDEKTDLAVLKVDTDKKLTAVDFGDSDDLRVGDWVIAIGNPFGLGGTVTAGIISARQRDINAGPYDDFLQTDASINRGNSGGPMFNLRGQVIGVNTAIFSPSGGSVGIGFAIPSSLAESIIDQIIEYGRTRRGWLGVRIQTVSDEIAESLGLGDATGALVAGVTDNGPADKAGIEAGDIILEFNGQSVKEMRSLPRMVAETGIGTNANVSVWRDNRRQKFNVEIGELEKAEEDGLIETAENLDNDHDSDKGVEIDDLDLSVVSLTDMTRDQFGIDQSIEGVVITEIERGSNPERKGIMAGDVIVEINQTPVSSPADILNSVKNARENNRESVLLLINQGGDVRFVGVKLSEEEQNDDDKDEDE